MAVDYSPFAGDMRERVMVQKEVDNPDNAGGGLQPTWTTIETVWAQISPVSSATRIMTMDQALQITHRVTMRYLSALAVPAASRYRLIWNGAEMRIAGVTNPDARQRFIEIMCVLGQMVGE